MSGTHDDDLLTLTFDVSKIQWRCSIPGPGNAIVFAPTLAIMRDVLKRLNLLGETPHDDNDKRTGIA